MKAKNIREFTTEEILARLLDEEDALLRMRLNHAVSSVESPSKIQKSRKMVARLKTILRERDIEQSKNA